MIVVNDYKLFKRIGKGSFGEVYLTQKGNNPEVYATKRLSLQLSNQKTIQKYLKNEIEIMKELNHPNIIRLYDLLKTNTHYYFIMEYCNGGPLSNLLSDYKLKYGRPFSQEIIQHFMRQIVEGLKYIHSFKIIHRDIKLDNILVNFENIEDKNNFYLLKSQVKIIDFGLATKLTINKLAETAAGSPIYMDPKILAKYNKAGGYDKLKGYNEKADIWSLGIICYEMLTGDTVYNNVVSMDQLMQKVEEGNYSIPLNCVLSNEIISFLNSMLQYDGDLRSSAEQLSQHKFLKKDVKDFTKADLDQIKNKINRGAIIINTKNNKTICRVFNRKTVVNENDGPIKEDNNSKKVANNPNNLLNNFQYTLNSANQNKQIKNINNIKKIPLNDTFNFNENTHNRLYEGLSSPNRIRIRKDYIEKKNENEIKELESMESSIQKLEELKNHKKESKINDIENIENLQKGKENDKWKIYINALLEEYKSAKDYFGQNNLKIQEQDASNKCLEIQNIKQQYELGYSMNLKNLPEPITPEYIYGYSTFERNKKFKELLNKYKNDRNKLKTRIESSQKYAITDNLKKENDIKKGDLTKLNYIIETLENGIKDEWTPAPEYTREIQKTLVERISYELCEFKLKIKIKNTDKNNTNFIISLKVNESKNLKKDIQLNAQNNYYEECIWSMNVNEWKNIDNNVDSFIFEIDYNKNNGGTPFRFIVNIAQVKIGKEISFNVKLPVTNNKKSVINMIITPIIPEGKKYMKTEERLFLIMKKIYPPFEGKSLLTYNKPDI